MKKVLITILFLCLTSCGPIMSPAIKFKNSSKSNEVVRNMKVNWNGYHLLKVSGPVSTCGTSEQNFNLNNPSDFFGPVHIEWENAKGKKLTKDFIFKKEDLPNFKRYGPYIYHYVALYFTQNGLEYYTSSNPDIKKIRKEKAGDYIIFGGECRKQSEIDFSKY